MIQQGSYLKVIDNTYVKEIACIKVRKGGKRPVGKQGDILVASVKSLRKVKASVLRSQKHIQTKGAGGKSAAKGVSKRSLQRGDVVRALIVRTRISADRSKGLGKRAKNQTGIRLSFPEENAAIILTANLKEPQGTRIKGPVSPTVRSKAYTKIFSLGGKLV